MPAPVDHAFLIEPAELCKQEGRWTEAGESRLDQVYARKRGQEQPPATHEVSQGDAEQHHTACQETNECFNLHIWLDHLYIYTHVLEIMSSPCSIVRMDKRAPLSDDALELIARRFAVLSEPMRLRLVHALFDGEKNVNALVEETGGTQGNISRHLQTLMQANVLTRRKNGLQVFYSIADPSIFNLCELVCGSLEKQFTKQAGAFAAGTRRRSTHGAALA